MEPFLNADRRTHFQTASPSRRMSGGSLQSSEAEYINTISPGFRLLWCMSCEVWCFSRGRPEPQDLRPESRDFGPSEKSQSMNTIGKSSQKGFHLNEAKTKALIKGQQAQCWKSTIKILKTRIQPCLLAEKSSKVISSHIGIQTHYWGNTALQEIRSSPIHHKPYHTHKVSPKPGNHKALVSTHPGSRTKQQ